MSSTRQTRFRRLRRAENVGHNASTTRPWATSSPSALRRRDMLHGALASPPSPRRVARSPSPPPSRPAPRAPASPRRSTSRRSTAGADDTHYVAEGYDADILIRWGDPVLPGAPAFDPAEADRGRAGEAVRLQQRLSRLSSRCRRGNPSDHGLLVRQSRVHQRGADVPRPRPAGHARAPSLRRHDQGTRRHRDDGAWRLGASRCARDGRQVGGGAELQLRPPHHRRTRRWRSPARPPATTG